MCSSQVTRLLLRSASVTTDSAIAASCDEPLAAGRVGRTPRGGSTHLVPAATVTTGAKPHGQQQLARDVEVERAVMGQRSRPQSFGEVQPCLYSSSSTSNERTEEMGTFLWLIDF